MIVQCMQCGENFEKVNACVKRTKRNFCDNECFLAHLDSQKIIVKCDFCGKENRVKRCRIECPHYFCSRSCAAKYNNKISPRKHRTKKCRTCDTLIVSGRSYCENCITDGKHIQGDRLDPTKTLGYYMGTRNDYNKYKRIREHANKVASRWEQKCYHCGYNKYVETCHIKAISDFPLTTPMGEINDPTNLILLCRNHHWEMDHGVLKIYNYIPPQELPAAPKSASIYERKHKVTWPDKNTLQCKINTINNWSAIGREYGVSSNTIRAWAIKYGLLPPK